MGLDEVVQKSEHSLGIKQLDIYNSEDYNSIELVKSGRFRIKSDA